MVVPYVAGATLYLAAGALNTRGGIALMAVSGAASSFGGTSGLAWGPQLLRGNLIPRGDAPPMGISRSAGWLALAAVVAVVFVVVLGRGISFGMS